MKNTITDQIKLAIEALPSINTGRQYWFVRTEGGSLYEAFCEDNLIAIGYDNIRVEEINGLSELESSKRAKQIYALMKKHYPEATQPGSGSANIFKFFFGIRAGDVVIIPSPSSQLLTFGIVQDDLVIIGRRTEERDLTQYKVRKVKWVKTVGRDRVNPKLYRLFYSHQAVVNGNEYAEYIDATINDFYLKDRKIHLQIRIEKEHEIHAKDLFTACLGFLEVTDDFLKINGIQENTSEVEVKIAVSSPGVVEFIGLSSLALMVLGFCIVALAGGGIKGKIPGTELEFKTDGLLQKISEFLDKHEKRKVLRMLTSQLDMRNPDDAVKVITKLIE